MGILGLFKRKITAESDDDMAFGSLESKESKLDRLKEPSTWAGIAALVAIFIPHVNAGDIITIGTNAAGIVAAIIAIVVREKGR
jgi:hypothetical protein